MLESRRIVFCHPLGATELVVSHGSGCCRSGYTTADIAQGGASILAHAEAADGAQELKVWYRGLGIRAGALHPAGRPVAFFEQLKCELMGDGLGVGARQQKGSEQAAQSPVCCQYQ